MRLWKVAFVVWALSDGHVVGYINAISDGVLNAFIPWLEVHPDFQNQGIGQELVNQIRQQLTGMYAIDLVCDAELTPYYLTPYYAKQVFQVCAGAARRNPSAIKAGQGR